MTFPLCRSLSTADFRIIKLLDPDLTVIDPRTRETLWSDPHALGRPVNSCEQCR
jgi:hypothetical protein